MLKLTASYGKKVPIEGQDYSSQNYHATVEVEIPTGLDQVELENRIHDTFALVKQSVEAELASPQEHAGGSGSITPYPPQQQQRAAAQRNGQPASEKQLAFLRDIANKRGMPVHDLDNTAHHQFGVTSINNLTRAQASRLIDHFNGNTSRQAA